MKRRPAVRAQMELFPGEMSDAGPQESVSSLEALNPLLELPQGLRLERNMALLAGAGAGKTHSLITMCLHLLGGARKGFEPLACAELALLTFTEKAADEMRARLRARVNALVRGETDEPELQDSCASAGVPFPSPAYWRAVADDLGAATIGTFHSLCMQLLRRVSASSFELLDEKDAQALWRDIVEREVLARVTARTSLRALVADVGFERLVDSLVPVAARIREEGLSPLYVRVADATLLRREFEDELRTVVAEAPQLPCETPQQRTRLPLVVSALRELRFDSFDAGFAAASEAAKGVRGWTAARERIERLGQLYGACAMAPFESEVRDTLVAVSQRYERVLEERGLLDFTGLLLQTRSVLRDNTEARAEAQRRWKALLVDEFQDTNRLQLELVLLLAEKRKGAPRPISAAFEAQHRELVELPLEPGFLAVVGDRKQAIYEFRGADVGVFEVMARAIEKQGGGRAYLRHSRRSTSALLEALNVGFSAVLGATAASQPPHAFEVVYETQFDNLLAVREQAPRGVPLVQLCNSKLEAAKRSAVDFRLADAEAVALAVRFGLQGGWHVVSRTTGEERVARGGDVAMLFQRFTQLEVYRQALVRAGVRHRVVRGRGFYSAQEVLDVASLLQLLVDPSDAVALSAVLRSPLVGLTDSQWVSLAHPRTGNRWHLDARALLLGTTFVPEFLAEFVAQYRALRADFSRLGLHALVRAVVDAFDYRVALAATPMAEQALANLEKLEELARQHDARGTTAAAFAQALLSLADDAPKEAEADIVDELDAEAVTLCTVHQAKGLEWPMVVLPDLAVPLRVESAPVQFERDLGLCVARRYGEHEVLSWSAVQVRAQLTRRARAENLRLLYVAMTRARDRVVLGLRPQQASDGSWAHEVEAFFPIQVAGSRSDVLDVATLKAEPPCAAAAPEPLPDDELRAWAQRKRRSVVVQPEVVSLSVTQADVLASCARRFHWTFNVGVEAESEARFFDDEADVPAVDARLRGTAAHRLLECTPLEWLVQPDLGAKLRVLRRELGLEAVASDEVLSWVHQFWESPHGRSFSRAEQVLREWPFALSLKRAHGFPRRLVLRGQIDAALVTAGGVVVLDYKTSARSEFSAEAYRFQLAWYAMAARRLLGSLAGDVRVGLVFLKDAPKEPLFFEGLTHDRLLASVWAAAEGLAQAQGTGQWPGQPRLHCEKTRCPYLSRCHSRT